MSEPGIEVPQAPRPGLLGALAKPGRPVTTLDDIDAVSDEMWRGTGYGAGE